MTALGLIVAIVAIIGGQALEGGHVSTLFQPAAFLIVIGGTLGAVLVQSHPQGFLSALRLLAYIRSDTNPQIEKEIEAFAGFGDIVRKHGKVHLEHQLAGISDPFLRKCLQLVADGNDADVVKTRLSQEARSQIINLRRGIKAWESAGGYAPTIGILGSVIGLLNIMQNIDDPSGLASGVAVAFVATIYGLASANLIFLPLANKFKHYAEDRQRLLEMRIEGALALADENGSLRILDRLQGFLHAEKV